MLERAPNHFELAVFSLLWSEHCGYKHSAPLLKRLPSSGERVLQGPGENAGVLDLGDGLAVAFKVESHNHPSAVEPFQGAATGVGGILRDVIAMGARPVALLNGLRFGEPGWKIDRAVAGIGHYGNCVGVPTVGGDTTFDPAYAENCLVNAMCVGLLPVERLMSAKASGEGNLLVLYGATTGRDGIGGASVLASAELSDADADKRPTVQIGDPFMGKKLIEVSVELVERGLVDSLQDCGAAGLASSLSEMAREVGVDIHLDRVPLREEGMEPWEVMISESQERMIAVVRPAFLEAVEAMCDRWELPHAVIGSVTDGGLMRCLWHGEEVGAIPARFLTDDCPRYLIEPTPRREQAPAPAPALPGDTRATLLGLLASPNIRDRSPLFEQYDHLVGSRTVRRPGLDAAVLRLRPAMKGLAITLDGSGRTGYLDPFTGGAGAILEAARNVACAGGEPIGLTDGLNFGNPEKGEIAWELRQSIEGMAQACEALGVPIVSGNVSLYNETNGRALHPTPYIGCVGLMPDVTKVPDRWRPGDALYLAGRPELRFDGSEAQAMWGRLEGCPAPLDLQAEAALVHFLWRKAPTFTLAHDAAEGGLAVALAEAALWSGSGCDITVTLTPVQLFGEGGGQAVVAVAPADAAKAEATAAAAGVPFRRIGTAGGDAVLGVPLADARAAWKTAL